jgi:hypothetical protein
MSPDDHVTFTAFEATRASRTIRYGEAGIVNAVREYVAGYRDALERLAEATDKFLTGSPRDACKHIEEMRAAEQHARKILEAGQ